MGQQLRQMVSPTGGLKQDPGANDLFSTISKHGHSFASDSRYSSAWVMVKGSSSLSSESVVELCASTTGLELHYASGAGFLSESFSLKQQGLLRT